MATRNVSKQANALAKARERRRALDRVRDEQDQRIEEATASVLVALDVCAEAERALESATGEVGAMLKALLVEDVSPERAAALLELDVAEVRRFVKAAPTDTSGADARTDRGPKQLAAQVSASSSADLDGAARRAS